MATNTYTTNGPRAGRGTGRQRNTLLNAQSKKAGGVPPPQLPPTAIAALTGQKAQLQMNLAGKLAAFQQNEALVRSRFAQQKTAANQNRIAGQVENVNANLQNGGGLGSFSLEQRARTDAARSAEIQSAIQERMQGRLGLRMERLQATNEYYTGLYDIQAQKAAMQQEAANRAFMEDMVMRMNDEQAPGVNTNVNQQLFNNLQQLLARVNGQGGAGGGGGAQGVNRNLDPRLYQNIPENLRKLMEQTGGMLHRGGQQ